MKHTLFFTVALILPFHLLAMENELSQTEEKCYQWFVEKQKTLPSCFKKLSPQDQETINKQIRFVDNPEAVTQARNHFAEAFYSLAQEANIPLEYDQEMLKVTLLKMTRIMQTQAIKKPTDLLTARMYVFSKLLTPEEKLTYSEPSYRKNPEAAHAVSRKWSHLVVKELVALQLIEDTHEAKNQTAEKLYAEQLERFEQQYGT